jgi:light-regulated signal transduction histidine kinase (bacteriophytochrome)
VVEHQLPPHWVGAKIHRGEGLAGQVVQTKKPMVVEDYLAWGGRLNTFSDSPARRVLGVPLKIHDQVTGVIVLVDKQVGSFSDEEVRLVSLFADQAAIAVTNAQFAAQLEERVAQRTSELEAANRELESLSYNIAHDMRSPVRAIVGYAGILRQTHRAQLDSEGLQLLETIRASGMRLGQLIDGFLAFLRLGHVTVHLQPVNMNSLVSQLLNALEPDLKERQVEFSVGNLPKCQADSKLLEQVWAQLLSNALKFTRPREVAHIELGSGNADGRQYYFVRDNGVGFEMKYAGKLFGVFQKLHYESDFEGTGIGLAIVRRIIQRHGGKVWAEAELDKGAAFYFTLTDSAGS